MNTRSAFALIAFALVATLAPAAAHADPIDDAIDAQIGLPVVMPTETRVAPAPVRDPSMVGRLPGRASVDMRAQDDDAGHRTEVVHTPAPRRAARHHRRDEIASR